MKKKHGKVPLRRVLRPFPHALLLAAIILAAVVIRAAHFADSADSPFFTRPMVDGQAYDAMALAINEGTLRPAPFYQDPLYPYLLAALYQLFGHAMPPVYVLQALLGILVVFLAWDATRLLFDRRAALLAALLVALYRPFIFYEVVIDKTALSVVLSSLFLWAVVRSLVARPPQTKPPHSPLSSSLLWPALSGVTLGLAALTRANLLLFAPLLAIAYIMPFRPRLTRVGLIRAAVACAGLALIIAPVSIRNTLLAREFVLTTTQAGQNFYIGNSPYNKTGQYEALPWVRAHPRFEETDMYEYAREQTGRNLKHSETSRFYFRSSFDWMKSNPGAFLKLLARKAILYLNNFEVPDNYDLGFLARYSWALRLPLFGFGLAFAFGFAGMALFFRRSAAHAALAVFFVIYSATVIAFFVLDRYRLPAVPALAPFAAGMAVLLWDSFRSRRYRSAAGYALLCVACFAVTMYPLKGSSRVTQAQSLVNLGAVYLEEGDTVRALESFRQALETQPGQAEALRNLGILQFHRGNQAEALANLTLAARSDRPNATTHYYLGMISESRGELDQALSQYKTGIRLKPSELKHRFGLATVLQKLGRYDEALAIYDTILSLTPDNPGARHNRAVALYHLGRYRDAAAELETVRRLGGPINPGFEPLLRAKLGP